MPSKTNYYPWFFFFRISRLILIVFLPTLFLILLLYRVSYKNGVVSEITDQLKEDLHLLSSTSLHFDEKWCQTLPPLKHAHYTLLKPEGKILCQTGSEKEIAASAFIHLKNQLILKKEMPKSALKENLNRFDRFIFWQIIPFAVLSYLIFIFLFYRSTKPLGAILSKLQKFKADLPFSTSLKLLYRKDEWSTIEEALNKADQKLQNQIEEVHLENEKNAAILESINDDIIAIDRFESVLFFNSKFQNNFMHVRIGQELDKKIWHIFQGQVLAAFREVLKTGTPQSLKAMRFSESHNPDRYFDLTITPLKSDDHIIGALGVFYDITEFKLTEQMRVDFVANVSHEIRTPLTSIKGFSQILQTQETKVDPSLRPFLDKIVANTERMISLFNDLLSLSVIESKNTLRSEAVSLNEIVSAVGSNIPANYPGKKIHFNKQLDLPVIRGDFRLLEQVIMNLCDNACKYSGEEVTIEIMSWKKEDKACLKIKDNGPGIAKEHLPRIFERFYRVDASRESLRGTGLGLSIVRQIISKHKGRIWAESEGHGSGTTFMIELPLE